MDKDVFSQSGFISDVLGVKKTTKKPVLKVGGKSVSLDFVHHSPTKPKFQPRTPAGSDTDVFLEAERVAAIVNSKRRHSIIQKLRTESAHTTTKSLDEEIDFSPFVIVPPPRKRRQDDDDIDSLERNSKKVFLSPPPPLPGRTYFPPTPYPRDATHDESDSDLADVLGSCLTTNLTTHSNTSRVRSPPSPPKDAISFSGKSPKSSSKSPSDMQDDDNIDEVVLKGIGPNSPLNEEISGSIIQPSPFVLLPNNYTTISKNNSDLLKNPTNSGNEIESEQTNIKKISTSKIISSSLLHDDNMIASSSYHSSFIQDSPFIFLKDQPKKEISSISLLNSQVSSTPPPSCGQPDSKYTTNMLEKDENIQIHSSKDLPGESISNNSNILVDKSNVNNLPSKYTYSTTKTDNVNNMRYATNNIPKNANANVHNASNSDIYYNTKSPHFNSAIKINNVNTKISKNNPANIHPSTSNVHPTKLVTSAKMGITNINNNATKNSSNFKPIITSGNKTTTSTTSTNLSNIPLPPTRFILHDTIPPDYSKYYDNTKNGNTVAIENENNNNKNDEKANTNSNNPNTDWFDSPSSSLLIKHMLENNW